MNNKYTYKSYSTIFPYLFTKEKERILSDIKNILSIEHVGSTAIAGLGGKGIIDIGIAVNQENMTEVSSHLQKLGYEFRPSFSTQNRFYFITYLPDSEEGKRRYHIHLTYQNSKEWNELIDFRNYLKNNPDAMDEYSELKKKASSLANQDGKVYRNLKEPFFEKANLIQNLPKLKMHEDELNIDLFLVQKLVSTQFPKWKDLPLKPISSAGTDNALYRLGNDMIVRLPRIHWAASDVDKESLWLPKIAPFIPFPISTPLEKGTASEGYPWSWAIYKWIEGYNPIVNRIANPESLLNDLVVFLKAMHTIDLDNGPASNRGVPLKEKDLETRKAIQELHGMIDTPSVLSLWEESLKIPSWSKKPVWVHGDLSPGNVLLKSDRLSGIIDFGSLGVGDPACDLIIAWNLLSANIREQFKKQLQVDESTWLRGRAWALSIALIQLPYYKNTNPVLAKNAKYVINEILSERKL